MSNAGYQGAPPEASPVKSQAAGSSGGGATGSGEDGLNEGQALLKSGYDGGKPSQRGPQPGSRTAARPSGSYGDNPKAVPPSTWASYGVLSGELLAAVERMWDEEEENREGEERPAARRREGDGRQPASPEVEAPVLASECVGATALGQAEEG